MKNLRLLFSFILLVSLFACDDPLDFDTLEATDFPPGILEVRPQGKQLVGNFDVKAIFVDGSVSPLSNASISMTNAAGAEVFNVSQDINGTLDSVVVEGSSFDASSLAVGDLFTINITVTDSKNQTTTSSFDFEISLLPFAANHNEMYIAGAFNGWGADTMTLVSDNIWEIKEVDVQSDGWKFKNCFDWCDEDWGDENCTGIMVSNTEPDGNGNTGATCVLPGLVNIRFNDRTLTYSSEPAVTFEGNASGLYLLGTFNNFEGSDFQFQQVSDNFWELKDVEIMQGAEFKFAESPDFMGKNWGDSGEAGKAEEFGPNIVFGEQTAFYDITFNDKTLAYTIEFVRFPSIGIIGDATPGGWDADTDMTDNGDGTFSVLISLTEGEAKFRANDEWTTNWGGDQFPTGVATQDGPNIPVSPAGVYNVVFNPTTGDYDFQPGVQSIGIIGSATPGGWDTDTDLNDNGDGTYSLLIELTTGEAKFRTNDDWATNWGGTDFPSGVGELDGPNIPVDSGFYNVTFNLATAEYNFAPGVESLGVIGDATPGGWDADTDMRDMGDGRYQIVMFLTEGAVKFRTNDDWATNWGGSGLSGTGVLDGDNIMVTAGLYTLTINPATAEYSVEPATIGLIGNATPGGWDSDTDMTLDTATGILSLTVELVDGEAKFRANDDWAWNWGDTAFPTGTGTQDGPNIPVTAGSYTITFNVNTGEYAFN